MGKTEERHTVGFNIQAAKQVTRWERLAPEFHKSLGISPLSILSCMRQEKGKPRAVVLPDGGQQIGIFRLEVER